MNLIIIKKGTQIHHIKGDTGYLAIKIDLVYNDRQDVEEYKIKSNDVLTFTVRNPVTQQEVINKEIVGANVFCLDPLDTSSLSVGRYKYDVQLVCDSGTFTVIPTCDFFLESEVTV